MMHDLSRWMWVSTKPAHTSRPPPCTSSFALAGSCGAPWMDIAAASLAAPSLHFSTAIALAFPRSPMITAELAWELAHDTKGKFHLGLGSQVKAHITKRYASTLDKPVPQLEDYVQAVETPSCRPFDGRAGSSTTALTTS